jgi:hypothetical protein
MLKTFFASAEAQRVLTPTAIARRWCATSSGENWSVKSAQQWPEHLADSSKTGSCTARPPEPSRRPVPKAFPAVRTSFFHPNLRRYATDGVGLACDVDDFQNPRVPVARAGHTLAALELVLGDSYHGHDRETFLLLRLLRKRSAALLESFLNHIRGPIHSCKLKSRTPIFNIGRPRWNVVIGQPTHVTIKIGLSG